MEKKRNFWQNYKGEIEILILLAVLIYLVFNFNRLEPGIYKLFDIHLGNVGSYNIVKLTRQFLTVAVLGCLFSITLGLIIGLLCFTTVGKQFRPIIDKLAMVLRAFPEIAMMRFVVPILGLGIWPSIVALTAHGVLPIIFAVTSGIDNIDPNLIKVAKGMGMDRGQIIRKVEFPLALPVIISGVRITLISCVGGATLATACGGEGLGVLMKAGQDTYNVVFIMETAIIICLMSLIVDKAARRLEERLYKANAEG